jgi:hypothetical protein
MRFVLVGSSLMLLVLTALQLPIGTASFATSSRTRFLAPQAIIDPRRISLSVRGDTRLHQRSRNDDAPPPEESFTDAELAEMKDLILSLSLETTDHDRRSRVQQVFVEALEQRPHGMLPPDKFAALFDKALTQVGDEVQMEAKRKLLREQQRDDDDVESAVEEGELRLKSPEELQLWALVDMMVQSKTIVKKRNGQLGSKGTFQ